MISICPFIAMYLLFGVFLVLDFPCEKDNWKGIILFVVFYPVFIVLGLLSLINIDRFNFLRRPKK